MKMHPLGETRDQREELTMHALSKVVRERMHARTRRRRMFQSELVRWSGISRSKIRSLLLAQQSTSLFLFLELCSAMSADPCDVLRELLSHRDVIRETPIEK